MAMAGIEDGGGGRWVLAAISNVQENVVQYVTGDIALSGSDPFLQAGISSYDRKLLFLYGCIAQTPKGGFER